MSEHTSAKFGSESWAWFFLVSQKLYFFYDCLPCLTLNRPTIQQSGVADVRMSRWVSVANGLARVV